MDSTIERDMDEMGKSHERIQRDLEGVKHSFGGLRKDVLDLLGAALGLGKHSAELAKDNAADAVETMKHRLHDLKDKGVEQVHQVEKKIADNPVPAMLIAFGAGFVLARMLTRK